MVDDNEVALKPEIRFPEFSEDWAKRSIDELLVRKSFAVQPKPGELYREIGIRSHGKGVFHKPPVTSDELGDKRVFEVVPNTLALNIVFAWEQALAILTDAENGFIASHRFPMFSGKARNGNIEFILRLFLRPRGKWLLELASPGGAGRNKTLGQQEFLKLKVTVPSLPEQQKIAAFLSAVDEKIAQLTQKKALLEEYKKGCMQQLFSQKFRFKDDQGNDFPDWEEKRLSEVFEEVSERVGERSVPTFSITAGRGFVSQEEKFGRDISGRQNEHYTVLSPGDFSYNKGNSKTYFYGCVYENIRSEQIAVPNVFISFRKRISGDCSGYFGKLFEAHYLDRHLRRIISSSARMDGLLNVSKEHFFKIQIPVPHPKEQQKISDFLAGIDRKIDLAEAELQLAQTFKKGLLQQMFV